MKKNLNVMSIVNMDTDEILLKMKLLTLIMFAALISATASSYSQATKFSMNIKDVTISDVFHKIEEQSEFVILFNEKTLDVNRKVDIEVTDETVDKILDQIFEGDRHAYKIIDRQIGIGKRDPLTGVIELPASLDELMADDKKLTGVVKDIKGEPIPGATVVVQGTNIGTITDADGKFKLSAPLDAKIIVVSFVGMKTQEFTIGNKTQFNVELNEEVIGLEEVVAIGYGTVKKSDLTGSVSKVKFEKVSERSATSMEQILQGQISGVQITQNSGDVGSGISFNIRGAASISGSTQPLIVIDGYPIDSDDNNIKASANMHAYLNMPPDNALSSLNPNDIESVEILKDASAAAIYGSRASNGVVLITTKRGKTGADKVQYNYRFDIGQIREKIDVLNSVDYINYRNEAYLNSGRDSLYNSVQIENYLKNDYNWQDLIYQTAVTNDHQLTFSGGEGKLKYAIGLSYLNQEGIVKNSSLDRGTIRVNLDREMNTNLKIGLNMSAAMYVKEGKMQSVGRIEPSSSVITGGLLTPPIELPYSVEDEINLTYVGNPLTMINLTKDHNKVTTLMTNMFAEYTITKGLVFRANGGINSTFSHRDMYQPRGTYVGNLFNGYAYRGHINSFNYLTEYTLNFNHTFNKKHRINAVAGYTWQEWITRSFAMTATGFPNDKLLYYNLSSASLIGSPSTVITQFGLSSFIGRLVYSYDGRYLLTITGRKDGSTRLAEGRKWDFFPSIALGWNVHKENFMKQLGYISEFKLRGSYGFSGNQAIAVGATQSTLGSIKAVINEAEQTGYLLSRLANKSLHWERTKQANAGFDIALIDNRITLSFDYYNRRTEDILLSLSIPPSNGFNTYNTNQGVIENKGYEFDLGGKILSGKFKWDASGNLSVNRNKIVDLGGVESFYGASFMGLYMSIAQVGQPIGMFYGYRASGIYQNAAEAAAGPVDAGSPNKPGTFKFEDISGPGGVPDNVITEYDRTIIGNPYPDFIFGVTNNFSWKGLSLSFLIQGAIGQDILNINRVYLDGLAAGYSYNVRQEAYDNRWTGEGTSNRYPQATYSQAPFGNRITNYVVEDGSFVRLKNVTLSYVMNLRKGLFFKNVKFYASAGNLLTWTNYKGYDPEVDSRSDILMMTGIDVGTIPQYRTFSTGINVEF